MLFAHTTKDGGNAVVPLDTRRVSREEWGPERVLGPSAAPRGRFFVVDEVDIFDPKNYHQYEGSNVKRRERGRGRE